MLLVLFWIQPGVAAEVRLTWRDNSNNETGFKIERRAGSVSGFTLLAVVGENATSYVDRSAVDGVMYCYRVRAYNNAGESSFAEACMNPPVPRAPVGRAEVIVDPKGGARLLIARTDNSFWGSQSTGTSFLTPERWAQHGGEYLGGRAAQYADVDGDGYTDLIYQGWDNSFWVSLSNGSGFTAPALWAQHGGTFVAGQAQYADVNGDGKADLVFQGWDNSFWVSLSNGSGFTTPALWARHGGTFVAGQAQYADVNGDGKADLTLHGTDDTFWVSSSTGSGFLSPQVWVRF
ncbi:MAG TPA: FG-GAP-like repeat-containing protein [candidate division Zixibacteria bacterium]|nr:FG-GAP-like repeat-containing protein [candidate division Zixibacteria bacterium]